VNTPSDFPTLNLSEETYNKLPGWVKGDSLVEGQDVRVVDVASAVLFLGLLVFYFNK
jgi:hypothetical protein